MKKKFIHSLVMLSGLSIYDLSAQPGNQKVEILEPVTRTYYEIAGVLTVNSGNLLRFESSDTSVKRLLVNASQGTVSQKGNDFIVMPESTGSLMLAIYNYNDIDNPILIEERKMSVVSAPEASIAGKNGGQISKEEFLKAGKIGCSGNYKITEFKLSVVGKATEYREFPGNGETLTDEMIAAIQLLGSGEKIFIEYIRAVPEQGVATRQISPLSFTVRK